MGKNNKYATIMSFDTEMRCRKARNLTAYLKYLKDLKRIVKLNNAKN